MSTLSVLPQTVEKLSDRLPDVVGDKTGDASEAYGEVVGTVIGSELFTASTYQFFATNSVALEDMSSGTTQLVAAASDDGNSTLQNIGFEFWYDGVRFSQFAANANGFIRLGAIPAGSSWTNNLGSASQTPVIAAFWDDLCVGTNGTVHYKTVGSAPNRKLVIEFQNLQITRGAGCAGVGGGTFQLWLNESASTVSPGVIQFVYGSGMIATVAGDGGYSIGLQSGTATNFASVTSSTATVSYVTANNAQTDAITAGTSFLFTPNIPTAAPTGLTFTPVTASSIQLNWADNASNEVGYAIYRSTDGTNYNFVSQTAADATSFNDTGLVPGTTYFYQVYAATEGAISSALSGTQATNPPGNDTCAATGGNWSETTTWADGSVPTATDNVTIGSGCTVAVDVTTAVALNVTIGSGGTLQSPATGAVVNNNLTVSGNVTNNGTLDFSTNGNTSGAILTFGAGVSDVTFGGSGATTNVRTIVVAKGVRSTVVELTVANFTVQGVDTDSAGFLTLTSGTFKISGTSTVTNRVFTTAGYSIPSLGGLWLNNPNFTVAGQNGSPTVTGLLRITQGTLNVGTGTGNSMGFATGSFINVEGGAVNTAGRFGVTGSTSAINYTQSGGTITVQTVGNTSTTLAGFDMGTSTASSVTISGGTIVVQLANTAASGPRDYRHQSGSTGIATVTGGTLQLGNASSGAAKTYTMRGVVPILVIDNTSAGHTGQWDTTVTNWNNISLNVTVSTGATVNFANAVFLFAGQTLTNNGTMTHNGASSRFITFNSTQAQTYTGSGTVTAPMNSFEFQSDLGFTFDPSVSTIVTNRVINFVGNVINSNRLTVGNGGTTTATIQIGNTTTPTAAGTFDTQLGFNPGTGGINITYLRTTLSRTTGGEIPTTRTVNNLAYDDNDPSHTLTIDGGDLAVSGALTLTNGVILTAANMLIHNGAATRTNGYVNGNLSRSYTATGAYTYHVGQNGYSPVAATVTTLTTNPSSLTVSPIDNTLTGLNAANSVSRYWSLTETGDLTADLGFTYLDGDVNGNEADYRVWKLASGVLTNQCSGGPCVNEATNTATVTGISDFSDWGIGEAGAVAFGELAFDSATYSVNEDGTTATITVTRTLGSANSVTVDYATAVGGTATGGATCTAGVDFINASGTLSFANADTSETFTVTVCDDSDVEGDETVNLALTNATGGATIGAQNTAVLTIVDIETPTGNVIVNPGNVAYTTLGEAVSAINAGTHTGAVTVDINANTTETGPIVLDSNGVGATSYTSVSIRPISDGVTVSGPSVQGRGLIELNGADNVTIDGDNPNSAGTNRNLTIQNTAANTINFTSVVRIVMATTGVGITNADNVAVRNVNILGSATGLNIATATASTGPQNQTWGILAGSGAGVTPAAVTSVSTTIGTGATAANLIVDNNSFTMVGRGVSINGAATTVFPGLQILGNSVGNPTAGEVDQVYAIGITVGGTANGIIRNNTVYVEGFVGTTNAVQGISVGVISVNTTGATIEKNKVNRAENNNPASWTATGINLGGGNNHIVQNNFVSGVINDQVAGTSAFGTSFGAYGIRVATGTGHKVYHNSVNLYGPMLGTVNTNLTAAFLIAGTGQSGADVRNNIFSNQITGGNPAGTKNTVVYLPPAGTSTMNLTLNNNVYFQGTDTLSTLAQVGAAFASSVAYQSADFDPNSTTPAANLRAYTSTLNAAGTNDNASKVVDPQFVSNTDLHILPTSLAESGGTDVGVIEDIDSESRSGVPDIGADEISVAGPGVVQFSTTNFSDEEGATATINVIRSAGTDGTVGVTATITDGTATGGLACTAGVDYINPGPQVLSFANGVSVQSFTVNLCTDALLEAGETVILTLSNPTGGTTIGANNPATMTIVDVPPPFTGTVNVGTGETFTSLTNPGGIFEAINGAGLGDNLTVNITSDLTAESGTVALSQFTETGAGGYTLTFKPSGAPRTISGTGAVSNGLINLNGTDRVVFDGSLSGGTDRSLTLTNNQTGTSTIFWIKSAGAANGATNNTIKNSIINGAGNATAQTTAGILAGSGVTIGGPAEAPNSNNTVTNNHIYRVQNSIYNQGNTGFDQNWTITNNEFGSTVEADKNMFRGMLMGNANNFVISGNTVLGVTNFTGTTGALSGIQLAFAVTNGTMTNNRVSNVHNLSTSGTGAFGMQLSATPTTNILIANNFISDIQAVGSATVTSNGHGITINGAATAGGYKIYHNSVNMNTNQTSGTTAALNITSAVVAPGAIDLRNNILANTQTAGATRFSVFSAAAASVFSSIDYNDYFSAGSVGSLGGTVRATLADWQTATGQDVNSLAVDPLFVSPSDLHLQAGSPMDDEGTPIVDVTTDIDGDARSATTPEIGADEIASPTTPGSLQFSNPTYVGDEDSSPFTVTVTRTGGTDGEVSVDFATSNGTATGGVSCTAGIDYVTTSGTLTFAAGVSSQTFNVTICNDILSESDETINYTLTNATGGATIGTPSSAVQTIIDDDPAGGSISIGDARVFEGKAGLTIATFTVTHTGSGFASVDYTTVNGTAIAGSDYITTTATLTFNAPTIGESGIPTQQLSVFVPVNGDVTREANETFFVALSNAVNATIADDRGAGIIVDDDRPYTADFDDDRISDFSVYRQADNRFYVRNSSDGTATVIDMGAAGDIPVPGDYNADGESDYALWRPSTGEWLVMLSGTPVTQTTVWGTLGDKPAQGDYDGDGRTDLAVYRPSTGQWWVRRSSDGTSYVVSFGIATDQPVQSDFDGDFKTDIAVYRDGTWYILLSSNGSVRIENWGIATDRPLAGDFDGDGSSDLAVYRDGDWWIVMSLSGTAVSMPWGLATDIPAPADFDGDGSTDIVVFRPSTGDWHVRLSSNGTTDGLHWGLPGDIPVPSAIIYDNSNLLP